MSTKLYPPQIAGSLPAFCKTYDILQDLSTGARITIPFIMNAGVGEAEVKGFALRLKTASSNTYICPVIYSTDWDREKSTVTFELKEEYANKLNEGQFYKVQIAYYNYKTEAVLNPTTGKYEETIMDVINSDNFIIGYYSTVGIVKCISKPKIFIEGYSSNTVNLFNGSFLGVYNQKDSLDKTEKVYSYRFDFYDIDDNLVHTSGELIHNINNDSDPDYSTDRYICNDFIKPTETCKLVYTVTTMNGYTGSSPRYKITANTRLAPGRYMEIVPTPIVEDGCIDVSCRGELVVNVEGKIEEALYYGEFLLSRASEEDGYVEWEQIQEFRLTSQKPSTFHFYDFSVKQGVKYIYAVQQFNMSKLYSTRMLSEPVSVDFEDMFLFDGERSLRIRFNPKVSSFKTTHLEKKVETIGGKYPFIFRNGAVGYKEFPVEGLISYNMDENQRFFKREELYNFYRQNEELRNKAMSQKYIENHRRTDLTEENVALERQFKIEVLNWLNNGEPKLFKSATEGNYIVRLINVSLTPEDILGRMLHTFKSTAIEIADCNLTNLKKYGFSIGGAISSFVPLWRTYDLRHLDRSSDGRGRELKFEQEVTSFKIEGALPRTKIYIYYSDSPIPEEVIIGETGFYSFSGSSRRVVKLLFIFENNLNILGQIECEYIGRRYSNFDAITDIKLQTIISNQVIGVNPSLINMKKSSTITQSWELAVDALIDTNYRTYFNKYLMHTQIEPYLNKTRTNIAGEYSDWVDLLKRLDILEEVDNGDGTTTTKTKENSSFDPSDTIQYIQTDFYDYKRNKLTILNMEQAKLRQRELIPVYAVPYEMITPVAWDKIPNNIRGKQKVEGTNYYSREDYENNEFPTTSLLYSTTPFGKPYPIDELITYLTLQVQTHEPMIDKYFIYDLYEYDRELGVWKKMDNASSNVPPFSGSYYDPHHKQLLETYDTTFYINDKYRYEPITKQDIKRYQNKYNVLNSDGQTILTNNQLYIKEEGKYILASSKFTFQDIYSFWIDSKEPDVYYLKFNNNIDLQYSKEMTFEQLGEVTSFGISNGIISEQTFQLQITDYYTEVNDSSTARAKDLYLQKSQFLKDVFKMFHNIEDLDMRQNKYHSLYKLYKTFLEGAAAADYSERSDGGKNDIYPINSYDILLLYIMLEKEYVEVPIIEQFLLKRLGGTAGLPDRIEIEQNLRRLITDYEGTAGVPIEIFIKEMFYTENSGNISDYENKKNIFINIYNQLNKYEELKLIDSEEQDLLSLLTDNKITGLDAKNQSLKKMHDLIAQEIDAKQQEAKDLAQQFQLAQENIITAYKNYNTNIANTAATEWLRQVGNYCCLGHKFPIENLTKKLFNILVQQRVNIFALFEWTEIEYIQQTQQVGVNTAGEPITQVVTVVKHTPRSGWNQVRSYPGLNEMTPVGNYENLRITAYQGQIANNMKLLDLLTLIEEVYTEEANRLNVESQYQQEQINKWKNFYKVNYDQSQALIAENIVLQKIRDDNNDDPDLDDYLYEKIKKNIKEIVILSAQMEIIEDPSGYKGEPIIPSDELSNYAGRILNIEDNEELYEQVYDEQILTKLQNLLGNLQSLGIDSMEQVTEENQTLLNLLQEFILEADNYDLYTDFTNFKTGFISLNGGQNDYGAIRDNYLTKIPATILITLKRNILIIDSSSGGNTSSSKDVFWRMNEELYLFSDDKKTGECYNIEEYKNRISALLTIARAIKNNVIASNSEDLTNLINITNETKDNQLSNFVSKIDEKAVENLNKIIDETNGVVSTYVDLLKNSKFMNETLWNELIESFDALYSPKESFIEVEPGSKPGSKCSNTNYQAKIALARDLNSSTSEVLYNTEKVQVQEQESADGESIKVYTSHGKIILQSNDTVTNVTKDTYIHSYRYFSQYYWNFIGKIVNNTDSISTGLLWWYIDKILAAEIKYQKDVLNDMEDLLSVYEIKLDNYNEKMNRYKEEYENSEKLFKQYEQEYSDVFEYYRSNAGNQYQLIDKAIADAKKYWNLFILELDLGYKREIERGMYG